MQNDCIENTEHNSIMSLTPSLYSGSRLERRHGVASATMSASIRLSTWGEATTHSSNLDDDQINIPVRVSNESSFKTRVESQVTANFRPAANGGGAQDSVSRPLEVLHGWDAGKAFPANHSHFQWGATVTRAPLHQIQPK